MSKPDLRTVLDQLRHLHPGLEGFSEAFTEALDRHITRRALRSRSVDATFGSGPMPEPFNYEPVSPAGRSLRDKLGDLLGIAYKQLEGQGIDDTPLTITLTGKQAAAAMQAVKDHQPTLRRSLEGASGHGPMSTILRELIEANEAAHQALTDAIDAHAKSVTHLWRLSIGATINQPQAPSLLKPPTTPVLITQDQALLIAARIGPFGVRQRANHAMRDWDAQRYTDTRMTLSNRMHAVAFPTNVNGPDPRD